jgi:predicted O-methyltransferase YrrM
MALLIKLMGAHNAIEVGVFTGYSALSVALALPPTGRLLACDISEEYTDVARRYWQQAGVADKIDLRIAPALDTLQARLKDGEAGLYDFAFIDADKTGYDAYYECCLQLLRRGGLILLDNTLRSGRVTERADSEDTAAIQTLNIKLHFDERVDLSLLPLSDGLTLARKR